MPNIRSSFLRLGPGAYVMRHPGNALAPLVLARSPAAADNGGTLQTIATAGELGLLLRDSNDCIMALVSGGPVQLLVSACLESADRPLPQLRLDRVALDALPTPTAPAPAAAPAAPKPITIGPHGISLIGHIQASGDRVAAPGEFLGDPQGKLPLEGFQAAWPDRPEGVDLSYGVTMERMPPAPDVLSGKFCGARHEGRITEVRFALTGPKATGWRLEGSAHFAGGFAVPVAPGKALCGPSGRELLTALRLRALPVEPKRKPGKK